MIRTSWLNESICVVGMVIAGFKVSNGESVA